MPLAFTEFLSWAKTIPDSLNMQPHLILKRKDSLVSPFHSTQYLTFDRQMCRADATPTRSPAPAGCPTISFRSDEELSAVRLLPSPTLDTKQQSRLSPILLTGQLSQGFPGPLLRFDNLLEQLTEFRKRVY